MTISLRAHQITSIQNRLKSHGDLNDVVELEGYTTALNVLETIQAIKSDPNVEIEVTDSGSSLCSSDCKVRPKIWHHCEGKDVKAYESSEAKRLGLKIGEKRPAKEIFDI